jgi:DNA-binding HxlR family transcriptional regulator
MNDALTACPVATTTRLIGGRWKARLIWALFREEPRRFSELRRACPPISDRILSKELRELEASGLIVRREHPGPTAHTDYRLTHDGRTLEPIMAAMAGWGLTRSEAAGEG